MLDHPLGAVLRNETYEFLGQKHRALLDAARREVPRARGAALATAVLGLLQPDIARDAQREGDAFFDRWLDHHGGERPRIRTREKLSAFISSEDETMETEDVRWVGLAVLVAVASGALVWLLALKRSETASAVPLGARPAPAPAPRPKPVRFAVAAFSGKVRDAGTTATNAGDLLTQATFWWVGSSDSWDGLAGSAGLSAIEKLPQTDDALLVVVYEAPQTSSGTPSSRPEGATRLREASRDRELRVVGVFAVSDPSQLSAVGFRR